MGLFDGLFGGGGTTTVQKADPWSGVQPYLKDVYGQARRVGNTPLEYYPGSTVVPFSPETQGQFGMLRGFSQSGQPGTGIGMNQLMDTAQGRYMSRSDAVNNALLQPATQNVNSQFSAAGRYGSGAHQGALQEASIRALEPIYQQERDRMMQASSKLPLVQSAYDQGQLTRAGALGQVGSALEGKQGEYLQDDISRFQFQQDEPFQRLQRYAGIVTPGAGLGGTSSSQSSNPLAGIIGGGLLGGGLGSMVQGFGAGPGSMLGPAGWLGLGGGALLGGLLG